MNERPDIVCATCGADEKALYDAVAQVIEAYKDKEGSLIMVLHAAQEIFGYLPMQLQEFIAEAKKLDSKSLQYILGIMKELNSRK